MPIVAADIDMHLSGGAGNADPNASLGGIRSTTQVVDNTLNNLFDDVSGADASAGDIEYRGVYVRNAHGSLTLLAAKVWISTQTPGGDDIAIALAGEGLNATMETIVNENTAPVGEVFSAPATEGAALVFGDIPTVQHYGLWIKRNVPASTGVQDNNSYVLTVKGDTAA